MLRMSFIFLISESVPTKYDEVFTTVGEGLFPTLFDFVFRIPSLGTGIGNQIGLYDYTGGKFQIGLNSFKLVGVIGNNNYECVAYLDGKLVETTNDIP